MAEKYKAPKIKSIDLGEKVETIRAEIDKMGMYNILVDFQQTDIGKEILKEYELEDIFEVFAYDEIFDIVIEHLNSMADEIDPMQFQAFMLVAAANYPDYITEAIKDDPNFLPPELVLMIHAILRKDESYIGIVTKIRKAIASKMGDYEPPADLIGDPLLVELSKVIEIEGDHQSFNGVMGDPVNFRRFSENLAAIAQSVSKEDLGFMIIGASRVHDMDITVANEFINNVKGIADHLDKEDVDKAINTAKLTVDRLEKETFRSTLRPSTELPEGISENSDRKEIIEAFLETEYGYEMLELAEVETLDEILKDEAIAKDALDRISAEFRQKGMHPLYFKTMMLALANAYAEMVYKYFTEHPYAIIYDPKIVKAVMEVLQAKGYEVSEDIFADPGIVEV